MTRAQHQQSFRRNPTAPRRGLHQLARVIFSLLATAPMSYAQEAPATKVLPAASVDDVLGGGTNSPSYSVGTPKALGVGKTALPRHRLQAAALDPQQLRAQLAVWEADLSLLTGTDAAAAESRGQLETQCGLARSQLGEFDAGEALLRRAEQSCRNALALSDPKQRYSRTRQLVLAVGNLGLHYQDLGDYPAAQGQLESALELMASAEPSDPLRAALLNDLANLHFDMGDFSTATRHYDELIAALRMYPEDAPSLSDALHNLALVYWKMGDFDAARRGIDESLAISRKLPGNNGLTHSLESFALICSSRGDDAEADAAYEQSLADYEERRFPPRDAVARVCNNWGLHCARTGRLAQAETLLERGLQMRRELYGPRHLDVADSLQDLGRLRDAQGRCTEAADLLGQSLEIVGERLAIVSRGQSERQQLAMAAAFRELLDLYLSETVRAGTPAAAVYARVLPVKGAVFERQRELRLARRWPELTKQFAALDSVSGQLARLTFASAGPREIERWNEQWLVLSQQREELERALAAAVGERGATLTSSLAEEVAALQRVLPAKTVLVDYLEYVHHEPIQQRRPTERRLLGFVVQSSGELQRVELGAIATLEPLVEQWRRDLQSGGSGGDTGLALRARLWEPLGAAVVQAETVLVSPDGQTNRLPLAALPGAVVGTYLIEQQGLATVPTPHYLPALLADRGSDVATDDEAFALLAIGHVDFDAASQPDAALADVSPRRRRRAGQLLHWDELPATRGELLAITDSFRQANPTARTQMLDRAAATEVEVRNAMPQAAYLHFATHGFFASSEFRSALTSARGAAGLTGATAVDVAAGQHPGLLSGLVLSGANSPNEQGDDGVLTALEVAELDLSRDELAVLSACETGLGEVAGGEGVLGLQRGFQVAGARTVIASLWKVDDEQTRQLMERFYENYWRKQLGMLESLREAQLWMLKEVSARDLRLRPKAEAPAEQQRTPPYYWAPFVLSGDWR